MTAAAAQTQSPQAPVQALPQPAKKLSNLQLELLKLYALGISDEELLMIKDFLAKYFAQKLMDEADRIWNEQGYTNELMEKWLTAKRGDLKK
jgi:Tfp pilus assembly protein FimV